MVGEKSPVTERIISIHANATVIGMGGLPQFKYTYLQDGSEKQGTCVLHDNYDFLNAVEKYAGHIGCNESEADRDLIRQRISGELMRYMDARSS